MLRPIHIFFITLSFLAIAGQVQGQLEQGDKETFAKCQDLHKEGNWLEARKLAEALVTKFSDAPASRHQLVFTNELANLNQRLGNHGEAIEGYQKCLSIASEVLGEKSPVEAQLKNNLAALMQTLGDFQTAENLNRDALALRISIEGQDSEKIVPAMNNLGSLLWCIGDYAGAEKLFRNALKIRTENLGVSHIDTARSMANLSGLLFYRDRVTEAAPLAEKAVEIFSQSSGIQHPDTLEAAMFLGEIRRAQKNPSAALELYGRCLDGRLAVFKSNQHAEVAEAHARIGDAHRELGDFEKALSAYAESGAIYDAVLRKNHSDKTQGIYGSGLAALALEDDARALNFARKLSEIEFFNLKAILQFTNERQRLAYQEMFQSQHLFANLGAAEELGTFLLRQKGLVIDSLIAEARLMKNYDDPLIGASVKELQQLRADYRTAFLRGNKDTSSIDEAVRKQHHKVLEQIGREDRELLTNASIGDIQQALKPGETLVDYLVYRKYSKGSEFENRYGAVVASADSLAFVDCGSAEDINGIVETLAGFLSNPELHNDETAREVMTRLYQELIQTALAAAPDTRSLILCPDSQLSFVPFAATIDETGKFLIEKISVSYVSASRALLKPESNLAPKNDAILIGNPEFSNTTAEKIPVSDRRGLLSTIGSTTLEFIASGLVPLEGAEREVAQLAPILETNGLSTRTLIGASATEEAIRDIIDQPAILHFATHGFYLPAFAPRTAENRNSGSVPDEVAGFHNPTFGSWIALTGSHETVTSWAGGSVPNPGTDGILMANEAAELNLEGTRVVTLSACDTATGQATGGDGVLGIRRGFRMAGAENVLTTLWPINDTVTVNIMKDFYSAMGNASPSDALNKVQRNWLVKIRDNPEAIQMPTQDGRTTPVGGLYWSLNLAAPFLLSR